VIAHKLHQRLLAVRSSQTIPYQLIKCACFSSKTEETPTSDPNSPKPAKPSIERVKVNRIGDGIVTVQLSRPDKLNSLDMPMFEAIASTAKSLRDDRTVRAVILSGEGRAFCTGLDLESVLTKGNPIRNINRLLDRPFDGNSISVSNLAQDVGYLWRLIPVPVIAVLHGMCFGGGMQISLGADMRYSTKDCRLSIMEAKWGLIPDMSGSLTLRELVRIDVAKELTMTGKIVLGTEAAEIGLVTRAVDDPMAEAMQLARQIVSRSPDSVASAKRLFQETWFAQEDRCLEIETELQKELLGSWNQVAASSRNLGISLPYIKV